MVYCRIFNTIYEHFVGCLKLTQIHVSLQDLHKNLQILPKMAEADLELCLSTALKLAREAGAVRCCCIF